MPHSATRDPKRAPTHPGALLSDTVLPAVKEQQPDLTKVAIAAMLGITRQHLNDICKGKKPVTPATAVRLGKLFGNGPDLWLRMQAAHDAWLAARKINLDEIPTLEFV